MFKKIAGSTRRLSKRSKIILVIAASLLVICGGAAGWFLWYQPYIQKVNEPILNSEEIYNNLFLSTDDKVVNNDYTGAMSAIDIQISKSSDNTQKARLYLLKYTTAYNLGKYDEAYRSALMAEEYYPTTSTATILGDCLLEMKQTDKAIEYYNKALSRFTGNSEFDTSEAEDVRQKILIAQGKKVVTE